MDARTRELIATHLKLGNKAMAQGLMAEALRKNPRDEEAWLAMARVLDDPVQKQECLDRVLALNPKNKSARQLLDRLSGDSAAEDAPDASDVGPPHVSSSLGTQPSGYLRRPSLSDRARSQRGGLRDGRAPVPRWMWTTLISAAVLALLVFCCGGLWATGALNGLFPPTRIPDTATSTFPTPLPSFTPTPVTPTATIFRLPTATLTPLPTWTETPSPAPT